MKRLNHLLTATLLATSIAFSGAALAADGQGMHKRGEWGKQRMEAMSAKLPPEKAKIFQDTMKGAYEKNKAIFEQVKKLREESRAIMTASTFDKAAWLAKGAEMSKLEAQAQSNRQEALASVAAQLTVDERKMLAEYKHRKQQDDAGKPAAN